MILHFLAIIEELCRAILGGGRETPAVTAALAPIRAALRELAAEAAAREAAAPPETPAPPALARALRRIFPTGRRPARSARRCGVPVRGPARPPDARKAASATVPTHALIVPYKKQ